MGINDRPGEKWVKGKGWIPDIISQQEELLQGTVGLRLVDILKDDYTQQIEDAIWNLQIQLLRQARRYRKWNKEQEE